MGWATSDGFFVVFDWYPPVIWNTWRLKITHQIDVSGKNRGFSIAMFDQKDAGPHLLPSQAPKHPWDAHRHALLGVLRCGRSCRLEKLRSETEEFGWLKMLKQS